ncbi:hypothetical protein TYRP_021921 [Tyrophagus putrescentiae]|nr:hypothetical protein TYRP_021921 [Tyrophagus putrescentiae]
MFEIANARHHKVMARKYVPANTNSQIGLYVLDFKPHLSIISWAIYQHLYFSSTSNEHIATQNSA